MKPVVAPVAYLLISHGSRDPRPKEAMNRLADLVRQRLEDSLQSAKTKGHRRPSSVETSVEGDSRSFAEDYSLGDSTKGQGASRTLLLTRPQFKSSAEAPPAHCDVIVGTACLELSPIELSEQIVKFAQRLMAAGVRELKLLPVFLMAGVHVMEDLPAEIAKAKQQLGDAIELTLCPHLGGHAQMLDVLNQRIEAVPAEAALLVAHGSRRSKGNRKIKMLGQQLNTEVAYWAIAPDIEEKIIELMQQGAQRIAIFPYFLFAGGITDAITLRTEELAERFPKVKFRLLPTLGATNEMADLAVYILLGSR